MKKKPSDGGKLSFRKESDPEKEAQRLKQLELNFAVGKRTAYENAAILNRKKKAMAFVIETQKKHLKEMELKKKKKNNSKTTPEAEKKEGREREEKKRLQRSQSLVDVIPRSLSEVGESKQTQLPSSPTLAERRRKKRMSLNDAKKRMDEKPANELKLNQSAPKLEVFCESEGEKIMKKLRSAVRNLEVNVGWMKQSSLGGRDDARVLPMPPKRTLSTGIEDEPRQFEEELDKEEKEPVAGIADEDSETEEDPVQFAQLPPTTSFVPIKKDDVVLPESDPDESEDCEEFDVEVVTHSSSNKSFFNQHAQVLSLRSFLHLKD